MGLHELVVFVFEAVAGGGESVEFADELIDTSPRSPDDPLTIPTKSIGGRWFLKLRTVG